MTALLRRSFRGAVTASRWIVAAPLLLLWLLVYLGIASFAALVVGYVTVLALDLGAGVDIAGTVWEFVLAVPLFGIAWLVAGSLWTERTGVGLWFWRRHGASHGSARFATQDERAGIEDRAGGLLIGRDIETGRALTYHGPAHVLTLAPTRSGKGVGTVIPNLLLPLRSVLAVDPKGENARITGQARSEIGPVHVLDPFGLTGFSSAAYNPLDGLAADSLDLGEDAATLAEALVMDPPGQVQDAHWNEEAKAILTGLILFCACHEDEERRTLATIREYLTLPPDRWQQLLELMQETSEANGLIARAANRFLGKSDREAASVLSSAQRHTHFLDSPRIANTLARSDFDFAILRRELASVFLVLPPDRLDTYARWLRLLVTQALRDIARAAERPQDGLGATETPDDRPGGSQRLQEAPERPEGATLFLLDEFAALGRLEAVERAMGLMAGYGLQLWPILQDLSQLRALYGPKANTFVANAGVLQTFGVNDLETAEWLSRSMGKETIGYESWSHRPGDPATRSINVTGRELLTPDEIMQLPSDLQLLRLQGEPPMLARKIRYYDDPDFAGLFEPGVR